jgi:hypothetical protein
MFKTIAFPLSVLAIGLGACFPAVPVTPEGQHVRLMKGDPPAGCEELKSVEGADTGFTASGADQDQAKARLKNAAGSIGGNYVRMETVEKAGNTVTFHGTAYRCPESAPAGPAGTPAPQPSPAK